MIPALRSRAVATRLGLLDSADYAYFIEFLTLAKELRAYMRSAGLSGEVRAAACRACARRERRVLMGTPGGRCPACSPCARAAARTLRCSSPSTADWYPAAPPRPRDPAYP
jgi:hypothetical protein